MSADRPAFTVEADATDVLTGLQVGARNAPPCCTGCARDIVEGERVTAYAYRLGSERSWGVRRVFCADCGYSRIDAPTLGAWECLFDATVSVCSRPGARDHERVLRDIAVVVASPPDEGSEPGGMA